MYPFFYAPAPKDILPDLKFPKGFRYGVATSAYQLEGAVKNEGKGPTMWDWATRQPSGTTDNITGDVVGLYYYLYKEDVECIAALRMTAHSFSISWARIYPFGAADSPLNTLGIDHYSDVHWDTPVALQAYYGGFTSPQIVDDFIKHTATVLKLVNILPIKPYFGKLTLRVDVTLAPGVNSSTAPYQCTYNLLKAHAGTVKKARHGEVTLLKTRLQLNAAFEIGLFSNPVYTTGDWPGIVKDTLSKEYLPRFTDEEKSDVLGSADFFSITSYCSLWIKAPDEGLDACVTNPSHPLWPALATSVQVTPLAIRPLLKDFYTRWRWYIFEFSILEPVVYVDADISQIKEDVDQTSTRYYLPGEMLSVSNMLFV
ncbi:glycoside hydrolase family 1 protein [Desarmillaria tabescens]|uniref:Glycoside hydrolase family 1 protein n=1 Tax=Armillaria tabescens TaxID=1929756 RepID=A0AA39MYB3_ARMTA|nr:glycoside hydrolase family 1 protein [Desarmillaria tabescens]KAK0451441.1 glycoside hydrolase family 1 protein [Desarmillaria tabescens]